MTEIKLWTSRAGKNTAFKQWAENNPEEYKALAKHLSDMAKQQIAKEDYKPFNFEEYWQRSQVETIWRWTFTSWNEDYTYPDIS